MKVYLLLLSLLLSSCTAIEIKEKDLFDAKRTIRLSTFEQLPYSAKEFEFFTPDSIALQAWFIDNPKSEKTVLYFGGNGFLIETSYHIILSIVEQGVDLLVFNYRGYGMNRGEPDIEGIKRDGLAAYDYLVRKQNVPPDSIILQGHSLGSFVATYTANQRNSNALILESPITDFEHWTDSALPWFLKPFLRFEPDSALMENSNLTQIKQVNVPVLIVSGKKDFITPPQLARKMYKTAKTDEKDILLIEEGDHNNLPRLKEYKDRLRKFYLRNF
jgi:pimeloyl-ACP methyl ester carboxylesterase